MKRVIFLLIVIGIALTGSAQIDTASFPEQRKQILDLLHHAGPGTEKSCGDLVAVGPKGDISFSRKNGRLPRQKNRLYSNP
jgi:hypothetical protein